jgi:hypothetical protein
MPVNPNSQTIDVRPCRRSYLTMLFIFLPLALFGLFVAFKGPTHEWVFVYVPILLGLGCVLSLRSTRLTIADETFSFQTLFRTRSIRLTDIEKAETELIGAGKGVYRALTVYPCPGIKRKPMRVNIGAFSREDLGRLFDLLSPKFEGRRSIGIYTDEKA